MTATTAIPQPMIDKPPAVADYAARAAFYELEYDDTADLPFLLAQVGPGVTSILEAPCGVGRRAAGGVRGGRRGGLHGGGGGALSGV